MENSQLRDMKPKELVYFLGFRPKPRVYGYQIVRFDLPVDGPIEYARWLHPRERKKSVSQEMVNELRKFLSPGDVAIDIGAHTGDTSLPIALAVGRSGCVLALEPNRYVFPILQKNAELNREKARIVPLMFAATTVDGEFEFEYSDPGFCNGGFHVGMSWWRHAHAFVLKVEGRNLLSYLRRECGELISRVRYIKVDAEGYDGTILESLADLVTAQRPYIRAEVFGKSGLDRRQQLYRTVVNLGYDVHRYESDTNYRGPRLEEGDFAREGGFDIFCTPRS